MDPLGTSISLIVKLCARERDVIVELQTLSNRALLGLSQAPLRGACWEQLPRDTRETVHNRLRQAGMLQSLLERGRAGD